MTRPAARADELYRKWYKPVRSWLRKRGNIPKLWIEDIAQEVFIRLFKYDPEINTNIAGYVFKIASNVAHEWVDRSYIRKSHSELEDVQEHVLGVIGSPEEIIEEYQEEQARLLRIELAMSRLKGRQLLVLMMHMYDRKTYGQIAKELGLTYRIVLRDLTNAYAFLRVELASMVEIYTPEEIDDEHNRGRVEEEPCGGGAGVRYTPPHVGPIDRVHNDRAANQPVLDSGADERLAAGDQESG